jgi:ATP-dependent Lon protease
MYTIRTKGYSTKEKVTIANDFLIPKIRQQVNFTQEEVIIPNETLEYIITTEGLTKCEDGVRNLKRCLEIIYTKLNLFRLVKTTDNFFNKEIDLKVSFPFTVTKKSVDALIKNDDKITSRSVLNSMYV